MPLDSCGTYCPQGLMLTVGDACAYRSGRESDSPLDQATPIGTRMVAGHRMIGVTEQCLAVP